MTPLMDDDIPDLDISNITVDEEPTPTRTRKPRSDKGQPRGPRGSRKVSNGLLAEQLLIPWATISFAASQAVPLVSAVMLERGEVTMKALVEIASGHPKMLNALKRAARVGPASELVQTGAMLLLAIAIETGRVPHDAMIAQKTGLTDLYAQVHPTEGDEQATQATPANVDFPFSGAST